MRGGYALKSSSDREKIGVRGWGAHVWVRGFAPADGWWLTSEAARLSSEARVRTGTRQAAGGRERGVQVEMREVAALAPYAGNARTHPEWQIAQIAASIAEFGFCNPILVGPDGVIIAGHGRLLAAEQLGLAEVPVIELGHLSAVQRRALVIADNKIAENAGWDEERLRSELAALPS